MITEHAAAAGMGAGRAAMVLAGGAVVEWGRIAGAAERQAAAFEGAGPVVNLCDDRLLFLILLLAAASAGRPTIVPSDRSPKGLRSVAERYPAAASYCDSEELSSRMLSAGLRPSMVRQGDPAQFPIRDLDPASLRDAEIVMFTSGSTGEPEACVRPLSFFEAGARANAECVLGGLAGAPGIVATSPPYHMYGLELSIAVPLFVGSTVHSGRPFYPSDIAAALSEVPEPRILVSTPVHLRVLKESGIDLPKVARVFSATAPLGRRIVRDIESMLGAELREIYGTTETGSVGWRNTSREEAFRPMRGTRVRVANGVSTVSSPHIAPPFELADQLEEAAGGGFRIVGRSNDIVNIAGKRMSLSGMNAILTGLGGVMDGAFFAPDDDDGAGPVERMTAFVVAPGRTADDIREQLRDRLDSAFLPRRIVHVDALPRNEAGKLPLDEFRRFACAILAAPGEAEQTVRFDAREPFFEDHFPGNPIVPGAVLLAEAGDFVARTLGDGDGARAASVDVVAARFPNSAKPGDDCLFRITRRKGAVISVECSQAGLPVLKTEMRLRIPQDG